MTGNCDVEYVPVKKINKLIKDAREKLLERNPDLSGMSDKKILNALHINTSSENYYMDKPSSGGKKKTKTRSKKTRKTKSSRKTRYQR